jgi:hypothetical protein
MQVTGVAPDRPAPSPVLERGQTPEQDRELFMGLDTSVRQETGKEQMVQVQYDEGVADHISPEPCAGIREGARSVGRGACRPAIEPRESYIPAGRRR